MIMPPMTKTLLLAPALLMGIACNDPNGLPPPVAKVTVSPSAANVLIGGTMQLVAQTEDVLVDTRGYIYITDKNQGLYILKYTGK